MDVSSYKSDFSFPFNGGCEDPFSMERISILTDELKRVSTTMRNTVLDKKARNYLREIESLVIQIQADLLEREMAPVGSLLLLDKGLSKFKNVHWVIPSRSQQSSIFLSNYILEFIRKPLSDVLRSAVSGLSQWGGGTILIKIEKSVSSVKFEIEFPQEIELDKLISCPQDESYTNFKNSIENLWGNLDIQGSTLNFSVPVHQSISMYTVLTTFEESKVHMALPLHSIALSKDGLSIKFGSEQISTEKLKSLGTYWCLRRDDSAGSHICPGEFEKIRLLEWDDLKKKVEQLK